MQSFPLDPSGHLSHSIPYIDPFANQGLKLPKWADLAAESLSFFPQKADAIAIQRLRENPKKLMFNIGWAFTYVALHDPSYRKFLHSTWDEVVDVIASQVAENLHICNQFATDDPNLKPLHYETQREQRRFQQQPCTAGTTHKRVELMQNWVSKKQSVLFLGDDDLVAPQLARAGFKDITVADIDPQVTGFIDEISAKENLGIKTIIHDFRMEPPKQLMDCNYSLVSLDPIYSSPGVKLFLDAAKSITRNSAAPVYFVNLHLLSLLRKGLKEVALLLEESNLDILDFRRSFNIYPAPKVTSTFIHIVNKTITRSPAMTAAGPLRFFTSDALILKPCNHKAQTLQSPEV